jgi:predicted O-methyltransferase YrrM
LNKLNLYVDSNLDNKKIITQFYRYEFKSKSRTMKIHSSIDHLTAITLNNLVKNNKYSNVLEIGMAFGTSSLAIIAALPKSGLLYSIDPYQTDTKHWDSVGLIRLNESNATHKHRLIQEKSFIALPELIKKGNLFDLVYIDGWHTFDGTLIDLFYSDKLLKPNGVIGVNDTNFASVNKALKWFISHRDYQEVVTDLPHKYRRIRHSGSKRRFWDDLIDGGLKFTPLGKLDKSLFNSVRSEDRYFRKMSTQEPSWDYFSPF